MDNKLLHELETLHSAAFGWAVSCCVGNLELAGDVLQEAYCRVLKDPSCFKKLSSARTWLFGIIRLTSLEYRRRDTRWREVGGKSELIPQVVSDQPGPDQPIIDRQRRDFLWSLLSSLPDRQRETLHLVFYQQMTLEEAADAIHFPRQGMHRAIGRCKLVLVSWIAQNEPSD